MTVLWLFVLAAVGSICTYAACTVRGRGDRETAHSRGPGQRGRRWDRRRLARALPLLLLGLSGLWLLGDFGYSAYVAHRIREWEKSVEWDPEGVELGCRGYTVGDGETALLMIHGINSSPGCFHKMAPALAGAGFTCRVVRLPGFAEPVQRYAAAGREEWLATAKRESEALRQDHRRVAVVGHSLGGAVGLALALDSPRSVDALVLLAPAIEVSDRRSPILPTRAWHRFAKHALWFTTVTYSPFDDACRDPEGQNYPGRTDFTPMAVAEESFRLMDRNRGRAAKLRAPLLVFLTKDDRVIDWRAAERFYHRAESTPKEIRFLQGSGHAIPVDYQWEEVSEQIAAFVRSEASLPRAASHPSEGRPSP